MKFAILVNRTKGQSKFPARGEALALERVVEVDYMSRMALEKDDFGRFSAIREFRVIGNWAEASRLEMGL